MTTSPTLSNDRSMAVDSEHDAYTVHTVRAEIEHQHARAGHVARRAVAATGLFGIALIHLLDLPSKISEAPYLGYGYIGLIVASLVLVEMLLRRDDALVWGAAASLSAAVVAGFVINRTVGMPQAHGDIGNWGEPLGLASLAVEAFVLLLALGRLVRR